MLTIPQRSRTRGGAAFKEQGAGEPVLLIHGVGMRLEAWEAQAEALKRTHRIIAVDMPGHGESDRLPDDAELPEFVKWFGDFLDDLGIDRINVAGHSMGALIAGGMAATMGRRIARVALISGVYRRGATAREAVIQRAEAIASGSFDVQSPLERWFGKGSETTEAYKLTRDWLSKVDLRGYATAYSAFARGDSVFADEWPNVTCPALFLTGDGDTNSSPEMSLAMADAAPNGWARIVKGHRHMVNLTAPAIVTDHLKEWLLRSEGP